jgi:putative sigma-54 modulation protein
MDKNRILLIDIFGYAAVVSSQPGVAMQIDIQSQGFPLTPALSGYADNRINYALSFASDRITRLIVRLSDINGVRGGKDKRCLLELRLKGAPGIVVEDVEEDLYAAIDRATERARRALVRKLDQAREIKHVEYGENTDESR